MTVTDILTGWSWSSVLITVIILHIMFYLKPFVFPKLTGVQGPRAIPIFGNFKIKDIGIDDLKYIKQYGKVFKILEGSWEALVVADTEILKHVLVKDFTNFTNRRVFIFRGIFKKGILDATDATWRRLRHLLTPSFTSSKLKRMIPIIDKCIDQLVTNLDSSVKKREKIELESKMGGFTMDVIASSAFGLEIDSQNDPHNPFITNAKKLSDINFSVFLPVIFFPYLVPLMEWLGVTSFSKEPQEFFDKFMARTIKERREQKNPRQDFLQFMLDAEHQEVDEEGKGDLQGVQAEESHQNKGFSYDEIKAQAFLFFLGASGTTSATLSFLLYNLATHQDCQDKVYEEVTRVMMDYNKADYEAVSKMPYLDQCIEETLRMYPPSIRFDRRAARDIDINGLHIPAGTVINVPIYAIHHDPDVWPEPEKFKPERFSPEAKQERNQFSYLPFGLGPRRCIGMRLGLMETKLAMVSLIQKFKFKDGGVPLDLDTSVVTKSNSGIWVYVESR